MLPQLHRAVLQSCSRSAARSSRCLSTSRAWHAEPEGELGCFVAEHILVCACGCDLHDVNGPMPPMQVAVRLEELRKAGRPGCAGCASRLMPV